MHSVIHLESKSLHINHEICQICNLSSKPKMIGHNSNNVMIASVITLVIPINITSRFSTIIFFSVFLLTMYQEAVYNQSH